jgi:protein TonB
VRVERRWVDGPWGRLAWTLPVALIMTALALAGFLDVLAGGASLPSASKPVAMQIIELPPEPSQVETSSTVDTPPPPETPPAIETPPPPQTPPVSTVVPTTTQPEPTPVIETPPPPAVTEVPAPVSPPKTETAPPHPPVQARKPRPTQPPLRRDLSRQRPQDQTAVPAQTPSSAPATQGRAGGITMGARALYQPMPDIPEELRHRELSVVAMARFHVAADGSATVTLLLATADPRLNAALMSALQKWRFFPAMANGRPIASTIDIRVPIQVH